MDTEHPAPKKRDLLLIVILLLLSAALGTGYYFKHRTPAPQGESTAAISDTSSPGEETPAEVEELPHLRAEVSIDGVVQTVLDLSEDQEVTIEGPNDGTNLLIIQDGEIWCDDASCPDKVCIYQGRQSRDGDIIVCLPNRMIVQLIEREEAPQ